MVLYIKQYKLISNENKYLWFVLWSGTQSVISTMHTSTLLCLLNDFCQGGEVQLLLYITCNRDQNKEILSVLSHESSETKSDRSDADFLAWRTKWCISDIIFQFKNALIDLKQRCRNVRSFKRFDPIIVGRIEFQNKGVPCIDRGSRSRRDRENARGQLGTRWLSC